MQPLAQLVRRLRMNRGLTQQELANRAGYTVPTLTKVESGLHPDRTWKPMVAIAMLDVLGKEEPVTQEEAHDFYVQSKVCISENGHLPEKILQRLIDRGIVKSQPSTVAIQAAAVQPSHESLPIDIDRMMIELIQIAGYENAKMFVHSAIAMAKAAIGMHPGISGDMPDVAHTQETAVTNRILATPSFDAADAVRAMKRSAARELPPAPSSRVDGPAMPKRRVAQ